LLDGTIAAATVPLFLSVIGNEKVTAVFGNIRIMDRDYQQALLILIGFCSLAAISSQRFLDSISRKVMQLSDKVEKVKQEVEEAKVLAEEQIEPDLGTTGSFEDRTDEADRLSGEQRNVLKALASGQFLMRSTGGLATTTRLSRDVVTAALSGLSELGLVRRLQTQKGERWVLTDEGRVTAASLRPGPN
jgi:DNA-binding MarR family transcriptional regulator